MRKGVSGFTIVELLIVIVVVAILATISVVAYNGIQIRARATAIVSDLRATEKALHAYRAVDGNSGWWLETTLSPTGTVNPSIQSIINSNSEFRNLLKNAPTKEGLDTSGGWIYDNDGDVYDGCSASGSGASLIISRPDVNPVMQAIDAAADDGNLSCGKIRFNGSSLIYGLD